MARQLFSFCVALSACLVAARAEAGPTMQLARASPTGKHCLNEPRTKLLLNQTLGAQLNPLGAEHQLTLSVCTPLIEKPGLLFDYTNVEAGVLNYLSPAYTHLGGFVSITPLSIFQLRAEASGLFIWPLPIDGAGYFPYASYQGDFSTAARPKEEAGSAMGYSLGLSATLRGEVGLGQGKKLLLADTLLTEYWSAGDAPYWYVLRRDVIAKRGDVVLKNSGALLFEIAATDNIAIRAGLLDDMVIVPGSDYIGNLAAGIVTMMFKSVGRVAKNLQPFVRVGVYTHHAFRDGQPSALAGFNVVYDLNPAPPP